VSHCIRGGFGGRRPEAFGYTADFLVWKGRGGLALRQAIYLWAFCRVYAPDLLEPGE